NGLVNLFEAMKSWPDDYAETRKAKLRVASLLKNSPDTQQTCVSFATGEPWTLCLEELLKRAEPTAQTHSAALLLHCDTAKSSKPAGKWLKEAEKLVGAVGPDSFAEVMLSTLAEIGKPGPPPKKSYSG